MWRETDRHNVFMHCSLHQRAVFIRYVEWQFEIPISICTNDGSFIYCIMFNITNLNNSSSLWLVSALQPCQGCYYMLPIGGMSFSRFCGWLSEGNVRYSKVDDLSSHQVWAMFSYDNIWPDSQMWLKCMVLLWKGIIFSTIHCDYVTVNCW